MSEVYIIDAESRPNEKLVDIYMKKIKEKAKSELDEKLKSIPEQYKKQETIDKHTEVAQEEYERKIDPSSPEHRKAMAVSTHFAKIVYVGVRQVDGEFEEVLTLKGFAKWLNDKCGCHHEKLKQENGNMESPRFNKWSSEAKYFTFVTYNGQSFDIHLIINELVKNNLTSKAIIRDLRKCTQKFMGNSPIIGHIDLMQELNPWGRAISLDMMMQIYLGIEKETKGEEFFSKATDKELAEHCREDLKYTEQLYKLFY